MMFIPFEYTKIIVKGKNEQVRNGWIHIDNIQAIIYDDEYAMWRIQMVYNYHFFLTEVQYEKFVKSLTDTDQA